MMIGAADYINAALRVKSNIDSGMFLGIQQAAVQALKLDREWHAERNTVYAERRAWVWKILDKLHFEYSKDQEGLFVWAKPKKEAQISSIPDFIDQTLEDKYVFFTPGMIFGSNGEGYIRISLCVEASKMEEAYHRL
jgi:aspartate/methionine/tyrosine aminotransferase